ncbi:Beta-ketoadipyl-CoA thiolase [Rhodococcus sp. B50]|nr:Beta-ketoadipyl-CoA thiolase [Rhodococcus sp. B50]
MPDLDPANVKDLLLGCGAPGGEQGFNMGRVVSVLLGMDTVPGTTVTRYCASSVQTTRMALHAIKAGEGEVFVSAGVEAISRGTRGHADTPPVAEGADPRDGRPTRGTNPRFRDAQTRTAKRATGDAPV